jgi:putative transposase
VEDVRGFLRTEVGRVLNRLVEQGKPRELVLERLDFRHCDLSPRLNAILRNCGRSILQDKLRDLEG